MSRLILAIPIIIMHISNILIIIKKRHLHKPGYYLLLNLSTADLMMVIATSIRFLILSNTNYYISMLQGLLFYSSLLSTVLISLDRYIAVIYCLRYRQIVNKRNLVISIIASYFVSSFLKLIPLVTSANIDLKDIRYYNKIDMVISYVTNFSCSVTLVCLSLIMLRNRRRHAKAIMKHKTYFGVEKEKLDILRGLKQGIKDVFRLNIATAIIVWSSVISKICYDFGIVNDFRIQTASTALRIMYMFTNPFLYAVTMSELRKCYYHGFKNIALKITCFLTCCDNRISRNEYEMN